MNSRRTIATGVVALIAAGGHIASAQSPTPDPDAWRPLVYADLQRPTSTTATFAEIWRDAIDENNRAYRARGDARYGNGNAPAIEAHFVVWSSGKSVVLSILNTATSCTLHESRPLANARIKLCPMRVAIYEGIRVRTLDGGQTCFLEATSPVGPPSASLATALASYDVAQRAIRLGMIVDRQPVDACSKTIPLYP